MVQTKVHEYEMDGRILSFTGFSMAGLSDLTTIGTVTGEALWPCSLLLADYLQTEWWPQPNTNVLELGCGLGLCGTIASLRLGSGNGTVSVTDGSPKVIARAEQIYQQNRQSFDAPLLHEVIEWGNQQQMDTVRQPNGFQLILGSDIFYKESEDVTPETTASLFVKTVDDLLADNIDGQVPTQCIVTLERRNIDLAILFDAFSKRGFTQSTPEGDYFEDIFGERNDEQTMFTNKFLVVFQRK